MIQQEPSAEMIQEPSAEIQEPPAEMQAAEGAAQLAASDPLSQASTACASPRRSQASTTPLGLPDADIDEDNLDVDDDSLQNLGHACVVVSDDEMRVRVASAMRGLDRLQRINIDPHELPTIRALFVRWTISQWALEGPSCTRIPAMQQQAPADLGHSDTKHSLVPGHCSGKNTHQVSHRKRARGDIDSCVVEVASLGCIRGPGAAPGDHYIAWLASVHALSPLLLRDHGVMLLVNGRVSQPLQAHFVHHLHHGCLRDLSAHLLRAPPGNINY
jgi:hypothetical protein